MTVGKVHSLAVAGVVLLMGPSLAVAQGIEPGWSLTSELSAVLSEGNSQALTLGMGAKAVHGWTLTQLTLEAKSISTESTKKTRVAVGTADDFHVVESEVREKTAEAMEVNARLDRTISDGVFGFAGVDWLRNTFAGVDGRFLMAVGGGSTVLDQENARLKLDMAATYTFQNDVVENPFVKRKFPGVQSGIDLWGRISPSAEAETKLVTDWNVQETKDVRLDWTTSLQVAVTQVVALKPSLQLLWRNQPSLTTVNLLTLGGSDTGETVTVPLEKLDLLFRVALVVSL